MYTNPKPSSPPFKRKGCKVHSIDFCVRHHGRISPPWEKTNCKLSRPEGPGNRCRISVIELSVMLSVYTVHNVYIHVLLVKN